MEDERERPWSRFVEQQRLYAGYGAMTERVIPIVMLESVTGEADA